jgi:hypothetical protein
MSRACIDFLVNIWYFVGMAETITFRPDKGIRECLEDLKEKEDRSLSWLINKLLREGLANLGYLDAESKTKPPKK